MTQQGRMPHRAQRLLSFVSHHSFTSTGVILLILSIVNVHLTAATPGIPKVTVASQKNYSYDYSHWPFYPTPSRQLMPIRKHISKTQVVSGVLLSTRVIHTVAGRELVYILDVDLSNPDVRLGVVQAYGRLISPDEKLTSMANRTGAIAGINGDYYEFQGSGAPIGEEVINGRLLHSPNPHYLAVLGVTWAGRLTIGPEVFSASVIDGSASHTLYSINHYSEFNNGRLLLFNAALGESVDVGGDPVAMIQPIAGSPSSYIVRSVSSSVTKLPVLSHQEALLGSGEAGWWITHTLSAGDRIRITTSISPDPNLKLAIGGGPVSLRMAVFSTTSTLPPRVPTTSVMLSRLLVYPGMEHMLFWLFSMEVHQMLLEAWG
jgi:hypothetical protein